MRPWQKFTIGLAAALAAGWLHHGPLGGGARLLDALEAHAQVRIRYTELPGIGVRMERDPMRRDAILSGPANDFQREGMGSYPGLNQRIATIPGIAGVRWAEGHRGIGGARLPLIAETLLLCALAFLVGLGLGRLIFGRRRRTSFLD
jgi:hypothetical protein